MILIKQIEENLPNKAISEFKVALTDIFSKLDFEDKVMAFLFLSTGWQIVTIVIFLVTRQLNWHR